MFHSIVRRVGVPLVLVSVLASGSAAAQAILGLRRDDNQMDDLVVSINATAVAVDGLPGDSNSSPLVSTGNDLAGGTTSASAAFGRATAFSQMGHEMLAFPIEGTVDSIVQLDSSAIVQGQAQVDAVPNGDIITTFAAAHGISDASGGNFEVVVDPHPRYCHLGLKIDSLFDVGVIPSGNAVLAPGARLYKELGDSFVDAIYTGNEWVVHVHMTRGARPAKDEVLVIPGQAFRVTEVATQNVVCNDVIDVRDVTLYDFGVGANDGNGPVINTMQEAIISHVVGWLKPRFGRLHPAGPPPPPPGG